MCAKVEMYSEVASLATIERKMVAVRKVLNSGQYKAFPLVREAFEQTLTALEFNYAQRESQLRGWGASLQNS